MTIQRNALMSTFLVRFAVDGKCEPFKYIRAGSCPDEYC